MATATTKSRYAPTEQTTGGADVRALSTETDVTVTVTDKNEDGSASMNRLQPEVATAIRATLSDVDGDLDILEDGTPLTFGTNTYTLGWVWYVSKVTEPLPDVDDHWIRATGTATTDTADPRISTYIPAGKRVANATLPAGITGDVAVDEGKYLRAVVTYLDMGHTDEAVSPATNVPVEGDIRTAIAVSANPVRAEVSSDNDGPNVVNPENGSPGFSSSGNYARSIPENSAKGTPLGAAVVATDPNGDTLTYELDNDKDPDTPFDIPDGGTAGEGRLTDNANDVKLFKVGVSDGQLTVNGTLNFESRPGGVYKFFIRATDPSGERDEQLVTVTATDVNDAPTIMGSLDEETLRANAENAATPPTAGSAPHLLSSWLTSRTATTRTETAARTRLIMVCPICLCLVRMAPAWAPTPCLPQRMRTRAARSSGPWRVMTQTTSS